MGINVMVMGARTGMVMVMAIAMATATAMLTDMATVTTRITPWT